MKETISMSVTININGQLILDQTSGIQADDVDVTSVGGVLGGALDSQFLTFLNTLGLSATQQAFAADVEGANQDGMVTVAVTAGETIGKLAFSAAGGGDFDGTQQVTGITTTSGEALFLWSEMNGHVVLAKTAAGAVVAAFYIESTDATNTTAKIESVTFQALTHPDATDPNDIINFTDIIRVAATIVSTTPVGGSLQVADDAPTISISDHGVNITVDETTLATNVSANFAAEFSKNFGTDGQGTDAAYTLTTAGGDTGLIDTLSGEHISLFQNGLTIEGRISGGLVSFVVSVAANGDVTLDQQRAIFHSPDTGPNQSISMAALNDSLIQLNATITDKDGDPASASLNIGSNLKFLDDTVTLTVESSAPDAAHAAHLGNKGGQSVTGQFGYDIGADAHSAAYYTAGGSDFVDNDTATAGVQLALTGTVSGATAAASDDTAITQATVTRASEDANTATFNWSFHYDKDPITAGVQDGSATGTLTFDKVHDTFTVTDTTPVEGFSFDVLHTSELVAKEPVSNVGHPNIVVETLVADNPATAAHDGFFVQFTGNNEPFSFTSNGQLSSSDTTFNGNNHDMFSSAGETWVSATQSTNGVAGDTIQKGEALTLRFFDGTPGIQTEATSPDNEVSAVAVKFDGIGNSEDLMVNLDLIDFGANGVRGGGDDTSITRAVYIENGDFYKGANVPAPWNAEFTLDNNDGLIIIESNDYNAAGEHYQIQGMQILQSANGMSGTASAINLNKVTGAAGGSNATTNLVNFDPTDNDVLKITDIGFVQQASGGQSASLDFAFNVSDADVDLLGVHHIDVNMANGFII